MAGPAAQTDRQHEQRQVESEDEKGEAHEWRRDPNGRLGIGPKGVEVASIKSKGRLPRWMWRHETHNEALRIAGGVARGVPLPEPLRLTLAQPRNAFNCAGEHFSPHG